MAHASLQGYPTNVRLFAVKIVTNEDICGLVAPWGDRLLCPSLSVMNECVSQSTETHTFLRDYCDVLVHKWVKSINIKSLGLLAEDLTSS